MQSKSLILLNFKAFRNKMLLMAFLLAEILKVLVPEKPWWQLYAAAIIAQITSYFFWPIEKTSRKKIIFFANIVFTTVLSWIYLVHERGISGLMTGDAIYFLSLPLIYLSINGLIYQKEEYFLDRFFLLFLSIELLFCLGQMPNGILGIVFTRPSDIIDDGSTIYSTMLSGSFYNANDLAATAGMLSVYLLVSKNTLDRHFISSMLLIILITVLTASRTALLVSVAILAWGLISLKSENKSFGKIFCYASISIILIIISVNYFNFENSEFTERIFSRLETFASIAQDGLRSDESIDSRYNSYLYFISNIFELGIGSGKLRDYNSFQTPDVYWLFFKNPHSFIIELSYWMGFLGLLTGVALCFGSFSLQHKTKSFILITSFILISAISSSIIGNHFIIIGYIACFLSITKNAPKIH